MSNSQRHGKTFEREVIEKCFGISPEAQAAVDPTAVFDIPLGVTTCKHPGGEPVSIKTAAMKAALDRVTVCLSDARRVWAWRGPLLLVVGVYSQQGPLKLFHTVYEFTFHLDELERLRLYGSITADEVRHFHETLTTYERGKHRQARAWAKLRKTELAPRAGAIQLNPKIDSKTQRRLQCSARLPDLESACGQSQRFEAGSDYRGLALPFQVESGEREFRKRHS